MIVRINQIDSARAEQLGGWPQERRIGAIRYVWPQRVNAFEILILETDEQHHPLARGFRQMQLRQLVPEVVAALQEPPEQVVVRLDGPFVDGELLDAIAHLRDGEGQCRFAMSSLRKLEENPSSAAVGSLRLHASMSRLKALCADPHVGLERAVRLRLFVAAEYLIDPLLECEELDDRRWAYLLPQTALVVGAGRGMQSLHLFTDRYDPLQARERLMRHLAEVARAS